MKHDFAKNIGRWMSLMRVYFSVNLELTSCLRLEWQCQAFQIVQYLVTFGDVRPFTDIVGRHVVHLRPKRSGAEDLCVALLVANCRLSDDWRAKIKSIDFYDCLPPAPQIPKNNAFRFKSFPDNPATTLKEFVRIGKLVTHDVWMDHLNDMDFERWFDTTVGDSSLENLARSLRQGQNRNRRLLFDLIRNRYRF